MFATGVTKTTAVIASAGGVGLEVHILQLHSENAANSLVFSADDETGSCEAMLACVRPFACTHARKVRRPFAHIRMLSNKKKKCARQATDRPCRGTDVSIINHTFPRTTTMEKIYLMTAHCAFLLCKASGCPYLGWLGGWLWLAQFVVLSSSAVCGAGRLSIVDGRYIVERVHSSG